ncbi:hypothetical protein PV762_25950 [Mitsuaria sp. CC2]|uniref:hypothetical protein n=1 Tax=Mitsuaria sp. CC2 TaxID=3029186 RepID=UPI003B8E3056
MTSYICHPWDEKIQRDIHWQGGIADAIDALEARGAPFAIWDQLSSPEGPCQRYLGYALYICLWDWRSPLARKYLTWAFETSSRALRDERFAIPPENRSRGWMNVPTFPGNRGEVRAVNAFASAVLEGASIDEADLKKSALEISQSALLSKGRAWNDDVIQARYLYAVRLLMICGEWDAAREMLFVKRKFGALPKHFELLSVLLRLGRREGLDGKVKSDFDHVEEYLEELIIPSNGKTFNVDAAWPEHCYRVEVALIRQRICSSEDAFQTWPMVFEAITKTGA